MQRLLALITSLALLALAPACGGGTGGAGGSTDANGSIVVGVLSNLRAGVDFQALHVVMKAGDEVVRDEVQKAGETLKIPAELPFDDLPSGTRVSVELEALSLYATGGAYDVLVRRSATSTIVGGKKLLLRVAIESSCVTAPGSSAPACQTPETCIAGQCRDAYVAPAVLLPYSPDWSVASNDPCKPLGGGDPIVIVGEGQGDYLPTMDGVTAQVEAGPQGGHHIWVATRMKNLAQSGSITSVTGHFPDLGIDVGPFDVIFTFEPDEGGYCKLFGLRFQLDQTHEIMPLLGHPLDVTVTVKDPAGEVGSGTRKVVLSPDFLQ